MGLFKSPEEVLVGTFDLYYSSDGSTHSVHTGISSCTIYIFNFLRMKSLSSVLGIAAFKRFGIQLIMLLILSNAMSYAFLLCLITGRSFSSKPERVNNATDYFESSKKYPSYLEFFRDAKRITYNYRSFTGWNVNAYSSKAINYSKTGIRETPVKSSLSHEGEVWITGGSTIWGYGVADEETIPSYLQMITGIRFSNLAEQGYTSRQTLNLLLNHLVNASITKLRL